MSQPSPRPGSDERLARVIAAGPLARRRIAGARLGPYVVEAELGRGGMGAVYRARHEGSGQVVALKVLLAGAGATRQQRARFRREAEITALVGEGAVAVHGTGEEDGLLYLALEYVEGGTLADAFARRPGWAEVVDLLVPVARTLARAHAAGIVHRDLKPENVLVRAADGVPLLADFGLGRDLNLSSSLTKTGAAVGTPSTMAPEQIRGQPPTPASDVYALGVLLYQGLTGRLPVEAPSLAVRYAAIVARPPAPPSALAPDVPPDLDALCLRCLQVRPDERYPDAGALLPALLALRGGGSAPRARALRAWLVPAALVVGLGLAVALARPGQGARQQAPTGATASVPSAAAATVPQPKAPAPLAAAPLAAGEAPPVAHYRALTAWLRQAPAEHRERQAARARLAHLCARPLLRVPAPPGVSGGRAMTKLRFLDDERLVVLWREVTGTRLVDVVSGAVSAVWEDFPPDCGRAGLDALVAPGGEAWVGVSMNRRLAWGRAAPGAPLQRRGPPWEGPPEGGVRAVALAPDGEWLAVGGTWDEVHLLSIHGDARRIGPLPYRVRALAVTRGAARVFVSVAIAEGEVDSGMLRLYDGVNNVILYEYPIPTSAAVARLAPDERTVVFGIGWGVASFDVESLELSYFPAVYPAPSGPGSPRATSPTARRWRSPATGGACSPPAGRGSSRGSAAGTSSRARTSAGRRASGTSTSWTSRPTASSWRARRAAESSRCGGWPRWIEPSVSAGQPPRPTLSSSPSK